MAYYYSPFRSEYKVPQADECPFCVPKNISLQSLKDSKGLIVENDYYTWIVNWYPRFEGHTMVVPKRHLLKLEEETLAEVLARNELILKAAEALKKLYQGAGVEIFLQTGKGSFSTVAHLHWHVTPASASDPLIAFEKIGEFDTKNEGEEKVVMYPIAIKYAREDLQKALAEFI